ncbi:MAG: Spy/CpxP family protein refolding chaperone [Gemmatimonadetes bacterium]|nr:Spy/CpxP family protein refolding chaperone [Gemmatimonadota bacterium]
MAGLALALVLAAARSLSAQEPQPQHGPGMMGMAMAGCPMMGAGHAGGAAAALAHRERLGLTADQVKRLEAIAAAEREAVRSREPALMRARADLLEASSPEINLDRARVPLERLEKLRTEVALEHLKARRDARQALTAEQRARLEALGGPRVMGGMHGMGGPGGMMGMMGMMQMCHRMMMGGMGEPMPGMMPGMMRPGAPRDTTKQRP